MYFINSILLNKRGHTPKPFCRDLTSYYENMDKNNKILYIKKFFASLHVRKKKLFGNCFPV